MLETAIALLAAHVLADFVFQLDWIVKHKRRPVVFALHIAVVALVSAFALGLWPGSVIDAGAAVFVVTLAHAVVDAVKTWGRAPQWLKTDRGWGFEAFCLDQLAHLASILLVAAWMPSAFFSGAWAAITPGQDALVLAALTLFGGFIAATRAGQFLLAEFMARFDLHETKSAAPGDQGLINGGAWIGLLERGLTFALVLAGRFEAIGFLIAAKSLLRFSYAAKDRAHSEYVIIGTLASFSWALVVAFATTLALRAL